MEITIKVDENGQIRLDVAKGMTGIVAVGLLEVAKSMILEGHKADTIPTTEAVEE